MKASKRLKRSIQTVRSEEKTGKVSNQNTKKYVNCLPNDIQTVPEGTLEEYPKSQCLDNVMKEQIAAKLKSIRKNYKKAVDK